MHAYPVQEQATFAQMNVAPSEAQSGSTLQSGSGAWQMPQPEGLPSGGAQYQPIMQSGSPWQSDPASPLPVVEPAPDPVPLALDEPPAPREPVPVDSADEPHADVMVARERIANGRKVFMARYSHVPCQRGKRAEQDAPRGAPAMILCRCVP
jgi:hypothetical protein